ncbi:ABC transporter substrate-binding protein [Paenibacillus ehimensis]|uniref:ABC transporter substrate-binding protein n=1 Tax=Paenibacillus ehimensis TaxID=79264 RepID=A0ABT8V5V2_9BACL|nr:ABC transporter substrate-binding protein [Paenibacillus ehimensis]MDO3676814.1 ABC transporter substrate-binding protein [Paenibacillus ehimensis]MEC0210401.1 ABC transporter substrate-binding protein [Paenibacillus ehimensis]
MRKSLHAIGASVLLLSTIGMTACSPADNKAGADGKKTEAPAAAKSSKQLTMYTAYPEDEVINYANEFEKASGIKVKFVRLSAGETLARLQAEKNNPQASVWYGGPSDTFVAAAKEGLLEAYTPKDIDKLPKEYLDKDGLWTPLYVGPLGFAVNTDWLKKNNIQTPETWEDLLKPEFKKNISISHPGSSGTAYTVLASLVQMMGEEKAFDYMKKLDANVLQYTKSGAAPAKQVGLGEAAVGISFSHDILKPKMEGYPVALVFPKDGTGYEVGAAALIKNAPAAELDNAKKFIDWAISKEAQNLYDKYKSYRLPVNTEANVSAGLTKISDLKVGKYDAVWAGQKRKELVAKFNDKIKGNDAAK